LDKIWVNCRGSQSTANRVWLSAIYSFSKSFNSVF
jgi:hypothetical protein